MAEKLVAIDGNSLVFRAFYAMQAPMITSRGVFTQAIYGFMNMLMKALDDTAPDYIAIAFDRKAPTFRHAEYGQYKAGRKKTPDELHAQFPWIKDILAAMRVTALELDGFEADDLIGTVCRRAEERGIDALVITGDRDELQLVSEHTSVMITRKGVSEFDLHTPESMLEKYGFPPGLFVDYKGLMGDTSDNIPGLPGVGEKTAAKLVMEFGGVEGVIARSAEIKPDRIRAIVEENAQTALMSKRLATIVTDVPIELDFDDMRMRPWDVARLTEIYTELEFKKLLAKLPAHAEKHGGGDVRHTSHHDNLVDAADSASGIETAIIEDVSGLGALREALGQGDGSAAGLWLFAGRGHVGPPDVHDVCVLVGDRLFCVHTSGKDALLAEASDAILASGRPVMGFGVQSDLYMLRRAAAAGGRLPRVADDAQVAHYLLAPQMGAVGLAQAAKEHCGIAVGEPPDPEGGILAQRTEDTAQYALCALAASRALAPRLREGLAAKGMLALYEDVELPLVRTLAETEANGFAFDAGAMDGIDAMIVGRLSELTAAIEADAGESFNINSPKQLGEVLFERLGLPGGKRNKNGFSTSADVLEKLRGAHPVVEHVLEYRALAKLKSTYIDGLPAFVSDDGRIRPHLRQTAVATGRLSCADPNLQNIPVRREPGRSLRKAFVAGAEGMVLLGADYSQIELRILAHLSEDPSLIADFEAGADIHRRTAARVFGVADEADVTPEQRSGAKAVNFGIIYGMSGFGLSEELSISRKEAERYIADYFAKHAMVKAYLDRCVADAKKSGFSTTIFGRTRPIPEIHASSFVTRQFGERLAMNTPIQGSAADIIKIAMNRVADRLCKEGLRARLILQVHDELILEAPESEAGATALALREEMENAAALRVPLVAEVKTAADWYALK